MVEYSDKFNGAKITRVALLDSIKWPGDYCNYRIVIKTDKGDIIFDGCHDVVPDIPEDFEQFVTVEQALHELEGRENK